PLQSLARAHPRLVDVELGPLPLDELTALVDEVLGGAAEGPALAALLHQRTGGTPLYVSQLLMALYAEGIIDTDRSRGRWRVDLDRARARGSSGDVVAFLVEQFQALPADLRRVLGIAACIGERFTIEALAEAADEAPTRVGALIWAAVSAGHLHPLDPDDAGAALPKPGEAGSTLVAPRAFGFVHDRLQQVARSSLEGDREALYLGLARRASQRAEPRQSPLDDAERVHTLARYIGHALPRVEDPEEALRFAAWCAEAGRLTRAAAAFERAAEHTGHARTLLARADAPRPERFARTLELAESLAMAGRREAAKACFEDAAALTDEPHQRAQRMLSQVTLAMVVGDTEAALAVVADAAAAFELDLRLGGDEAWMGGLMARVLGAVEAAAAEAPLTELPPLPADDRFHAALGHMLLASTNAAYLSGDINLYAALALTLIDMGLGHGVGEVTGVAFVQLAIIFASALADYEGARRFCTLGFTLLERFPDSPLWGMANIIRGTTIQPWIEHMPTSVPLLEAAHVRLRASGMVLNAGYAYFCVVMNAFSMGAPLASVVEQGERAFAYLEKFGDRPLAAATQAHLDACDRLREHAPRRAANPRADREAAALNPAALFVIHSVSAFTAWVLGESEEADAALAGVGPALAAGTGLFPWAVFQVVAAARACERLEGAPDLDEPERAALVETVDQTRAMLARWRESCPANADSFAHLLEGAWAGAQGEHDAALRAYTAAADAAAEADFLAIEGLANERAAALLEGRGGTPRAAVGYLVYARAAYRRWGARVLERRVAAKLRALGHAETSTEAKAPVTETLYTLDVSSLVRMSMALSESTQVEDLLAQLLALAGENAGADRCAVLLMEAGGLHLHADQRAGEAVHSLAPPVPLSTLGDDLAARMVEACRRSSSPLVVDDTEAPPQLGSPSWRNRDPYLGRAAVRSALALPMTERGVTVGVLYLENRVTPGAFTRQHLRVLGTLAAQAAVSIANARLFTAARGREARWRALATSAPDAIMIVDEQRRIRYANREAFGRTPTELAEVRVDELVSPADREALASAVAFVFSTGSTTACEVGVPTPAGRRSYTTRMGPILGELGVDQVTLIATDVTEQRQLEQQLRQSQKMQAVGTLAGGVAHDFNNLLTVILGACELGELDLEQLSDLPPALAQSLGDAFSEIGGAAQRAAELTRQLLAFSRRQVLAPKHFDLNALASGISRMLTRLLGERVELAIELDPQPCGVHADRGQLEQVIVNLAVNARDAMAEGGTVTLRTRRVVIPPGAGQGQRRDAVLGATPPAAAHLATTGELPVGRAVVLEVQDTGAGMDAETLARVFEPFFTTKASGEGTGLGLATVLGIADQSGGAMVVATQLGVGSRFCLVLPVDESHTQAELAPAPTHVPVGGDEHVLVVEDDPGVQRLVALLLGGHGYQVHTASGGEAALALAEELRAQGSQLDLVLTDVVMPGMTGPEVAEAVRTLHPGVATLFMSGYTNDAMVRHGIATGGANFLQKPFTRPSLLQTVRSALDSPRTP
ncbi:multi-sensor hybrid histidine kinase, partial [Plesiocystis pacifica SIR-1]